MKTALRVALFGLTVSIACWARAEDEPKLVTPAEAAAKINETVRLEMKINSASLRNGMCFLNSEEDFKSDKNFTIFLSKEVVAKFKEAMIDDPAVHFKGKTVIIQGKVTIFREHPQIALDKPESIKELEKK